MAALTSAPMLQQSKSGFAGKQLKQNAPRAAPAAAAVPTQAAVKTVEKVDEKVLMDSINSIRFLSIDGVEKANSGHPGLPMGAAPMAYVVYREAMKHNPKSPKWANRDRFVLSAGHGSMLQYSLMYLAGYESVQKEDLMQFRQWQSKTPGHPENFETEGIEVTTGPLGTGVGNAVGLAMGEAHLAARFNKPDMTVIDHYTYCIMGDGCNMEGVANEACSLAGHLGLGKLICLYDDNHISIDGHTDISFTEDVAARYAAMGWHIQHVEDGNTDIDGIRAAIEAAKAVTDKPSLIKVTTLIGYGSPNKADTHDVHGAPLGAEENAATRANMSWEYPPFEVPEAALDNMRSLVSEGAAAEASWEETFAAYKEAYPEEGKELSSIISGELPEGWEKALPTFTPEDKGLATRLHSQTMLNALAPAIPGFLGGSADLAPSNMTLMKMFGDFQKDTPEERNLRFGVREHGMGAIANGLALYSPGLVPYCATFFIFSDYMRGAMRVGALSNARVIYVMTHDSIGLGEDGPTHQPIEHLASFRAMPGMLMWRPCDGNETAGAYKYAVTATGPSTLALTRQGLPNQPKSTIEKTCMGAYVIHGPEAGEECDSIVIATGSEVPLAIEAAEEMGPSCRVVSMPCWEVFEMQSAEYKESILPASVTNKVSVEAGCTMGWEKYAPKNIGINHFGASAPAGILFKEFGFTKEAILKSLKA